MSEKDKVKSKRNIKNLNFNQNLVEKMKKILPMAFEDGKLSKHKLLFHLNLLDIDDEECSREIFGLNWQGKWKALQEIREETHKTLKPQFSQSWNFENDPNIFIEGENLQVLKIIEQTYLNKFDIIYIDPPYNTGHDFIYKDNYKEDIDKYLRDEKGNLKGLFYENSKVSPHFHTDWLNFMFSRLILAQKVLNDQGIILISIDDNEQARLKVLCDEIFGITNFITTIIWQKKNSGSGDDSGDLKTLTEYVLVYVKNANKVKFAKKLRDVQDGTYNLKDTYVNERGMHKLKQLDMASLTWSDKLDYEVLHQGKKHYPGNSYDAFLERKNGFHTIKDWQWRWSKEQLEKGIKNDFVVFKNNKIYSKQYQYVDRNENKIKRDSPYENLILNTDASGSSGTQEQKDLFGKKVFDHPKPLSLLTYLLNLSPNKNARVLDFFAGTGTTAHALLKLNKDDGGNRKYFLVQIYEAIKDNKDFKSVSDICRERLRLVHKKTIGGIPFLQAR